MKPKRSFLPELFQSSSPFSFLAFLADSFLKFWPEMTGLPVWASMSLRVLPATAPPSWASFFSGGHAL